MLWQAYASREDFFFLNDTASTEFSALSLHDALPICSEVAAFAADPDSAPRWYVNIEAAEWKTPPPLRVGSRIAFVDRKSTRLNSSHANISYAVFCMKKKNTTY